MKRDRMMEEYDRLYRNTISRRTRDMARRTYGSAQEVRSLPHPGGALSAGFWTETDEERQQSPSYGRRYESLPLSILVNEAIQLLEKNYRIRMGEIDLILRAPDQTLVFCEVKYRSSDRCGSLSRLSTGRKQRIISRVASFYLASHGIGQEVRCRFDIIGITSGQQSTS